MTYPLIQRPAPGQQLAEMIQQIKAQRDEQQMEQMRRLLLGAQLEEAQQGLAEAPMRREARQQTIEASRASTEHTRAQTRRLEEQTRESRERMARLAQTLSTLPENLRLPLGAIITLGEDVPAEVRTSVFEQLGGKRNDADQARQMNLALSILRTGAGQINAASAFAAAGIARPESIPADFMVPAYANPTMALRQAQAEVARLTAASQANQALSDRYQTTRTAFEKEERARLGGPSYSLLAGGRNVPLTDPAQERRAQEAVTRRMAQQFNRVVNGRRQVITIEDLRAQQLQINSALSQAAGMGALAGPPGTDPLENAFNEVIRRP